MERGRLDVSAFAQPCVYGATLVKKPKNPTKVPNVPGKHLYDEFVPVILKRVTSNLDLPFKHVLKEHDLLVSQWHVVAALSTGEELSLKDVGLLTSLDQPTLSRIVDQMVARGLVHRAPKPTDGRFIEIRLTPKGEELLHEIWPKLWKAYRDYFDPLTKKEELQFTQLLHKLLGQKA